MSREARFDRIRVTDITLDFKQAVPPIGITVKGSYADERGNMYGQVVGVSFSRDVHQMIAALRQQMEHELEAMAFVGEGNVDARPTMASATAEVPRSIGDHINPDEVPSL